MSEDKLTIDDPVTQEVLDQFLQLANARSQLAERLLEIEQQRIQILAAVKKADDERARLFEAVLVERGVPPTSVAEIDAKTGKITLIEPNQPQ